MIDRSRLSSLYAEEQKLFLSRNPKSKAAYESADNLFGRVPMIWMNKKAGGFPICFDRTSGNRTWDIDGHEHIDFALGDTVTIIKDLKVKGFSTSIKVGTKVRNIRLVNGPDGHEIDAKVDGFGSLNLKLRVVKEVLS